ncbi:tRNA (adenosine(37)-N6)-dimethylallyltransferase MiaA [Bacillota bacterium]
MSGKIVIIVGPTAVGKTKYALNIAASLNGEIISADSMQIYKDMTIGNAKPSQEELAEVPHHLIGEIDPFQSWSVADYQREAKKRIAGIFSRGRLPIVSGGTGLYVNSLIYEMNFADIKEDTNLRKELQDIAGTHGGGYLHARLKKSDPLGAERIHPNNIKKLIRAIEVAESTGQSVGPFERAFVRSRDYDCIIVGLNRSRELLYNRIDERVDAMMAGGLLEEVRGLVARGLTQEYNSMKGIGYKELINHILGKCSLNEAVMQIKQNSRNYAKRQLTWFRRYDDIRWFDLGENENFLECAGEIREYIREGLA